MPKVGHVEIDKSGVVKVDGRQILSMGWSIQCDPDDMAVLTIRTPVVDLTLPGDAEYKLAYIASFADPMGIEATGETPQEAMRALADALDAYEGPKA